MGAEVDLHSFVADNMDSAIPGDGRITKRRGEKENQTEKTGAHGGCSVYNGQAIDPLFMLPMF